MSQQNVRNLALNKVLKSNPEASVRTLGNILFKENTALFHTAISAYSFVRRNLAKCKKPKFSSNKTEMDKSLDGNVGFITTRSANITTLEAALAYSKVDLSVWEVSKHEINSWEVTVGDPPETYTNFQVKVYLRKLVLENRVKSVFDDMLKAFKGVSVHRGTTHGPSSGMLFEVDIFDPHWGKLCWAKETGHNYDISIASEKYGAALEGLISRASGFDISRILYVVGNDFFHVDNGLNQTTKGTAQDVDGRWQKAFVEGRKAVAESILRLNQIAPVDVLMVSGNHDEEKVFYLGEVLSGIFAKTKGVTVDNEPMMRKYYHYGQNLIGFTHGNCEKHANLPLIMATEKPEEWAKSRYREFHIGHYHQLKTISFLPVQEFNTIRVRTLSSLTPPDAWHKKMGYEGLRSANGFIWDKEEGMVGSVSHQPR